MNSMKLSALKLQAKGWTQEEISHAQLILSKAEQEKHPRIVALEKALYWFLLLVVLVGSIAGTWLIEPFLIFISRLGAIFIIFVFGIIFGALASILIKDMEDLAPHHHLIITLIIPISAIITSYLITSRAHEASQLINITTQHNPLLLGIMYSIGALIPFAILLWFEWREEHGTY